MRIETARWTSRLLLLCLPVGAIGAAAGVMQIASPASTPRAAPAGREMMQLLHDEHETMRLFLAEEDAKLRAIAAIESEPEPEQSIAMAEAEPDGAMPRLAFAKHSPAKRVRLAKATVPVSIAPPAPMLRPGAEPPPPHTSGWVHEAYRLPRRLWAAVGELMDDRPPIPPRPIPPV